MSDIYADWHSYLDKALDYARLRCDHQRRPFDRADARDAADHALRSWLHLPEPRPAPDALLVAVDDDLPHCLGGNCSCPQH